MCPFKGGNRVFPVLCTEKKIAMFSQSKEGKSPLHMAAIHGRFTRSQILIQNGMDLGDFVLPSPPSPGELIPRNPFLSLVYLLYLPVRISTESSEQGTCRNGPGLHAPSPEAYRQDNTCGMLSLGCGT